MLNEITDPPHPSLWPSATEYWAIDEASYGSKAPDGRHSAGLEAKRIHRAVA